MQPFHSTINMATLEADIGLHDTGTMMAFHRLYDHSSSEWDVDTATWAIPFKKLVMVFLETSFKANLRHGHLPFVKIIQDLLNYRSMTTNHHFRPFDQNSPSIFILEGKQLLDFLHHSVLYCLFVCLGTQEKAFYFVPEMP